MNEEKEPKDLLRLYVLENMAEQKKYQCEACGYEFVSYRQPKLCPYCGKENSVKPVKTAADILDEVGEE